MKDDNQKKNRTIFRKVARQFSSLWLFVIHVDARNKFSLGACNPFGKSRAFISLLQEPKQSNEKFLKSTKTKSDCFIKLIIIFLIIIKNYY